MTHYQEPKKLNPSLHYKFTPPSNCISQYDSVSIMPVCFPLFVSVIIKFN